MAEHHKARAMALSNQQELGDVKCKKAFFVNKSRKLALADPMVASALLHQIGGDNNGFSAAV